MADRIFVIYAKTLGTATARPVLEYYTEDETHVPDIQQLGYTLAAAGFAVIESLDLLAPASGEDRNKLTIDPATATTTATAVPRYDILRDQTEVLGRVADLIAEWNWTQELDARITQGTQAAFARWIEQLEAVDTDPLWATNPKGIALPATPSVAAAPLTVAEQIAAAGWLKPNSVTASKIGVGDLTNFVLNTELETADGWSMASGVSLVNGGSLPTAATMPGSFMLSNVTAVAYATYDMLIPVSYPGQQFTLGARFRASGVQPIQFTPRVVARWFDKDRRLITGPLTFAITNFPALTTAGVYLEQSVDVVAPEGAAFVQFAFGRDGTQAGERNPGYIEAPYARPKVEGHRLTDATVPSQKLNLSNWDSLQPLWGFDTADFSPFVVGPSPTPTATLSWVTGRSGARAMRVTTNTDGAIAQVDTLGTMAFATSPGEALVVEGWMRASHSGTSFSLGLGGFANRFTSIPEQAGSSGAMSVGTSWQFFSAIVNVPAGTTRWACGRFRTEAVFNQTRWVEIDGLTIKRLARLPSAHAQSRTSLDINSTQADFSAAQIALSLNFTRNAASIIRLDAAAALLVPSNAPGDQLNAVFWLTKVPVGGPETVLASWVEQGAGNLLSRATRFTITDTETPETTGVLYYLRVSKQGSTATVRLGDRSLNAMMLPRI